MDSAQNHWNDIYRSRPADEVSWYQARPELSLSLIHSFAPDKSAPIIDVGGGASRLVDELLASGYLDITVLDISEAALARPKARLGEAADKIRWIVADITIWRPDRSWAVWHDRAVFHFLTGGEGQDGYIAALESATKTEAAVIISTFAPNGPERCSGLIVQRYSPATLAQRLGPRFHLISDAAETHVTPAGNSQAFSYAVLRRQ